MNRTRTAAVLIAGALLASAASLTADVRTEEKTLVKFEGMLGRMANMFGGKAARDGITSVVAVQGDRKASLNEQSGQIIDLREEKIYDLDMRRKQYTVTTFAELRRRMEEAMKKAEQNAKEDKTETVDDAACGGHERDRRVRHPLRQAARRPDDLGSVGGLLGGLARRTQKPQEPNTRATFMTSTNEILKIGTSVGETDVSIPAGFNEDK